MSKQLYSLAHQFVILWISFTALILLTLFQEFVLIRNNDNDNDDNNNFC